LERRRLTGEIWALVSPALERLGVLAAFTERTGGASTGPFASLNLALGTGDEGAAVAANRERLSTALGIAELVTARQVHGDRLHEVEAPVDGDRETPEADGLTTRSSGLPLTILIADCVPLVLASAREGAVAAVHVGWRGLSAGLVQRAVGSFSRPDGLQAAIGPSIGPCHYEVGEDVVQAVQAGTHGEARLRPLPGQLPRLDLPGTVEAVLRREGVGEVERAPECTACEPLRFFSHRRDGRTGRQALVAVRL
jgi:polyphenol oxidase